MDFSRQKWLDPDALKFVTPDLALRFEDGGFHTDAKDPTRHEVQVTLKSNYTLSREALENALSLEVVGGTDLFTYKGVRPAALWQLVEDEKSAGRIFYLRSARIAVPDAADFVKFGVAGSLRAVSGGSELGEQAVTKERVPDRLSGFAIAGVEGKVVRTPDGVPEQVLLVETSGYVEGDELAGKVRCWVIPREWDRAHKRPGTAEAVGKVPDAWMPVKLELRQAAGANDAGVSQMHAFKFLQEEGAALFVHIEAGVEAMGGFELADDYAVYAGVPSFPKEVMILGKGGVMALNGERKLGLKTRGVEYLRTTFARIPEDQINHLVAVTNGDFESPNFNNRWVFSEENMGRYQRKVVPVVAPNDYEASFPVLDLEEAMGDVSGAADESRGLFFVTVEGVRPGGAAPGAMEGDDTMSGWIPLDGESIKKRFVLVTDLGMLVKRASDGSRAVFVQSISRGEPVAGVRVSVVAKNGSELMASRTDDNGYVWLGSVDHLKEEKQPTAIVAKLGADVAFLPYQRPDRLIDFSRFDIGGVSASEREKLEAFVFTERGIYRPGDEVHIGAVVRRRDWAGKLEGVPLVLEVRDARGSVVGTSKAPLAADGFVDFSVQLNEASPTGGYHAVLYYRGDYNRLVYLGGSSVRVEDFQPDTMKLDVEIGGAERAKGWIKPEPTTARVQLNTLFGFPAADRRVTAILEQSQSGELKELAPMAAGYVSASFDPASQALRFELDKGKSDGGAFYQVVESGYDKGAPQAVVRDGLEVARELVDADGNPVTQIRVGEPVIVRIAVRNISPRVLDALAVLDLLPGGFEVEANALKPGAGTVPGAEFVDVREDRNVFFLGLGKNDLRTFSYRIKPVAAGTFAIPPIFAESMYDPGIKGRSGGGSIEVLPADEDN